MYYCTSLQAQIKIQTKNLMFGAIILEQINHLLKIKKEMDWNDSNKILPQHEQDVVIGIKVFHGIETDLGYYDKYWGWFLHDGTPIEKPDYWKEIHDN